MSDNTQQGASPGPGIAGQRATLGHAYSQLAGLPFYIEEKINGYRPFSSVMAP
ncbi:hypothetical protein RA180_13960 [Aeromonas salmonicida]|uniref:hypothetical protein n=1 Tax=Aeromonas salmonicida TaxID=645 RepID=UPI002796B0E2|nr:hypothetical protein [Aeromonas salmonicida]MDQ1885099.1 hypothetical protein [Aeromonas salmonicida]